MLKFLVIFLFPLTGFSYPELLSKNCASCHSESSGFGLLTKDYIKSDSYFKIETPDWLLLGAKVDLKQTFTETPYEKNASFKATRLEAQLGFSRMVNSYLNVSAQGSLNRIEPRGKSDAISDYVYSPYRFISLNYADSADFTVSLVHGFYRNQIQSELLPFETSYKQSELVFNRSNHQLNIGYIAKTKSFDNSITVDNSFINYKYFQPEHYSVILGHQWGDQFQQSSLGLVSKRSELVTLRALLTQTLAEGKKGLKARVIPVYQRNSLLKIYGVAEYQNSNIKIAKPRTIIYGFGADYECFTQCLVSVTYTKTDDSSVLNNPMQILEINLHLYM